MSAVDSHLDDILCTVLHGRGRGLAGYGLGAVGIGGAGVGEEVEHALRVSGHFDGTRIEEL